MLILKGIIIGIGKIIPGVSGSMLAISMGVYDKLINCINDFFKDKKNNFKYLLKLGIGVVISIIFFSNIILKCLNNYYIITIFFFIGLILGSFKSINNYLLKKNNYIIFITFFIVFGLGFININNIINIDNYFYCFLFFILAGFVDAFTMVIPGISGTATLMMMGAYDMLMHTFATMFELENLFKNIKILFPFSIGLIMGIIITAKLVNYLFKHYKNKTYSGIIGFSIGTIFMMAFKCIKSNYTLTELILSYLMLFIGILISKKINH